MFLWPLHSFLIQISGSSKTLLVTNASQHLALLQGFWIQQHKYSSKSKVPVSWQSSNFRGYQQLMNVTGLQEFVPHTLFQTKLPATRKVKHWWLQK